MPARPGRFRRRGPGRSARRQPASASRAGPCPGPGRRRRRSPRRGRRPSQRAGRRRGGRRPRWRAGSPPPPRTGPPAGWLGDLYHQAAAADLHQRVISPHPDLPADHPVRHRVEGVLGVEVALGGGAPIAGSDRGMATSSAKGAPIADSSRAALVGVQEVNCVHITHSGPIMSWLAPLCLLARASALRSA